MIFHTTLQTEILVARLQHTVRSHRVAISTAVPPAELCQLKKGLGFTQEVEHTGFQISTITRELYNCPLLILSSEDVGGKQDPSSKTLILTLHPFSNSSQVGKLAFSSFILPKSVGYGISFGSWYPKSRFPHNSFSRPGDSISIHTERDELNTDSSSSPGLCSGSTGSTAAAWLGEGKGGRRVPETLSSYQQQSFIKVYCHSFPILTPSLNCRPVFPNSYLSVNFMKKSQT